MGTLKDIADLVEKSVNKIKDRQAIAIFSQIQSMISSFQSEQAAFHENYLAMQSKYATLQTKVASLQTELAECRKNKPETIIEIDNKIEDIQENILKLIADRPEITEQEINSIFKQDPNVIKYHITYLSRSKHIQRNVHLDIPFSSPMPDNFTINHLGTEYLMEHGLLK
jgi:uncharacterized membrane protein required for colicin V production